jgi:hypothetical protein
MRVRLDICGTAMYDIASDMSSMVVLYPTAQKKIVGWKFWKDVLVI